MIGRGGFCYGTSAPIATKQHPRGSHELGHGELTHVLRANSAAVLSRAVSEYTLEAWAEKIDAKRRALTAVEMHRAHDEAEAVERSLYRQRRPWGAA
jgi:hypothetical protein